MSKALLLSSGIDCSLKTIFETMLNPNDKIAKFINKVMKGLV